MPINAGSMMIKLRTTAIVVAYSLGVPEPKKRPPITSINALTNAAALYPAGTSRKRRCRGREESIVTNPLSDERASLRHAPARGKLRAHHRTGPWLPRRCRDRWRRIVLEDRLVESGCHPCHEPVSETTGDAGRNHDQGLGER